MAFVIVTVYNKISAGFRLFLELKGQHFLSVQTTLFG